jgi:large repetitive protein
LRLESQGTTHRVYYNGVQMLSYNDSQYAMGQPGIADAEFGGPTVKILSFTGGTLTNSAPVATNVTIAGIPHMSSTLTGQYSYSDVDNDPQGTSTFRWLKDGSPINGAVAATYVPALGDLGHFIVFEVTPVASSGVVQGQAVQSGSVMIVDPPLITSATATTFTAGSMGTFTYTATGTPAPAFSLTGTLPSGVAFNATTGVLSGTPAAGSGGVYPLILIASNGANPNATQNFTLTIDEAPAITSPNNATFTVGVAGSFLLTASGFPAPSITESVGLPSGITYNPTTHMLSGTAAAGTARVTPYTINFTASNGVGSNFVQTFSLTVNQIPAITSANSATFAVGVRGTFTITATGSPLPTLSLTGILPQGVTFTPGTGSAALVGTPTAASVGTYNLTLTASNGVGTDASQNFTLIVVNSFAPMFTSASSTTFTVGTYSAFMVTAAGGPPPTLSVSGKLPSGVTFTPSTGLLAGTPAAGTGRIYNLTFTAKNGVTPNASQAFVLTVDEAPSITTASSTTLTVGTAKPFTIKSTGFPTPALTESGALPSGVTFVDNGDGTAALGGTALPGSGGKYSILLTASSGVGAAFTQNFTLTVDEAAAVTSGTSATFTVGALGSFTVTASGYPVPSLTRSGTLPSGITFTDNADGTGTLKGTPAAGTGKVYSFTFTAKSSGTSSTTQSFTLTVNEAPTITTAASSTFTVGKATTFNVKSRGFPYPALTETGALPPGVSFTDNLDGTATLSGTPGSGTGGIYNLVVRSSNPVGPDYVQNFVLTVNQAPQITSANAATFGIGVANSFIVTTTGFPTQNTLSESGALPKGVTFKNNGNGTATLSGTPSGVGATYNLTFTAKNGVGTNATQAFTLTVH